MRFAGDKSGALFEPQSFSGGGGGNYSAAAGAVDVGNSFAAMREKAPKFDLLSAEAMKNQTAENVAAQEAEAAVAGAGISAFGQTKGYALSAQAQIKAAEKAAEAQKQSSMMGAIGGVVGMGVKALTGGFG